MKQVFGIIAAGSLLAITLAAGLLVAVAAVPTLVRRLAKGYTRAEWIELAIIGALAFFGFFAVAVIGAYR